MSDHDVAADPVSRPLRPVGTPPRPGSPNPPRTGHVVYDSAERAFVAVRPPAGNTVGLEWLHLGYRAAPGATQMSMDYLLGLLARSDPVLLFSLPGKSAAETANLLHRLTTGELAPLLGAHERYLEERRRVIALALELEADVVVPLCAGKPT